MPGTLRANHDFDASAVVESLRNAMSGLGTNEGAIIETLVSHDNKQRQEIDESYKAAYGKELVEDLQSELGGYFEDSCVAMLRHPRLYDARQMHWAMSGAGTSECTLIEILTTRSNEEIAEIKEHYKNEFESELEDDLQGETSGYFERLLVSLCTGARDDSPGVDYDKATEDAEKFHNAGPAVWGTEEAELNAILCLRSRQQLRQTMIHYESIHGSTMEEAVESECGGNLQNGYLAIIRSTKDLPGYFARRLHDSMEGLGTSDQNLIRIIVSRSEIDLVEIREAYERDYETPLVDAIASECGGEYKNILIAVVNGNGN